jgi:hypothetical protein
LVSLSICPKYIDHIEEAEASYLANPRTDSFNPHQIAVMYLVFIGPDKFTYRAVAHGSRNKILPSRKLGVCRIMTTYCGTILCFW